MSAALELTKANRLALGRAFAGVARVDLSIECIVEGQMGRAFVDDLCQPSAWCITVGPFWYFAGEPCGAGGRALLELFPEYNLLMPSAPGWLELAQAIFGGRLESFPRYSFSAESLQVERLQAIVNGSTYRERILPLDASLVQKLTTLPEPYLEIGDYDSVEDFLTRSFGFTLLEGDTPLGVAYASLVSSRGIEVSVYVEEPFRRAGVATALSASLLLKAVGYNLRPNWDAANPESCKLALKLGYTYSGSYDAYYYTAAR